jgi:hypothetical protein
MIKMSQILISEKQIHSFHRFGSNVNTPLKLNTLSIQSVHTGIQKRIFHSKQIHLFLAERDGMNSRMWTIQRFNYQSNTFLLMNIMN